MGQQAGVGKRMGRPSKGPRHERKVRLPLQLDAAVARNAARAGLTVQDYLIRLAIEATGVDPYRQEELRLSA